eukprot:4392321-Amphidinium_carterae.1
MLTATGKASSTAQHHVIHILADLNLVPGPPKRLDGRGSPEVAVMLSLTGPRPNPRPLVVLSKSQRSKQSGYHSHLVWPKVPNLYDDIIAQSHATQCQDKTKPGIGKTQNHPPPQNYPKKEHQSQKKTKLRTIQCRPKCLPTDLNVFQN